MAPGLVWFGLKRDPQYMHADVQMLLVQCAESSGNPLTFANAVRNSHTLDPTLPWSRVCSYAIRLMQDNVRPINAWAAAFAHHLNRSRSPHLRIARITRLIIPAPRAVSCVTRRAALR